MCPGVGGMPTPQGEGKGGLLVLDFVFPQRGKYEQVKCDYRPSSEFTKGSWALSCLLANPQDEPSKRMKLTERPTRFSGRWAPSQCGDGGHVRWPQHHGQDSIFKSSRPLALILLGKLALQ